MKCHSVLLGSLSSSDHTVPQSLSGLPDIFASSQFLQPMCQFGSFGRQNTEVELGVQEIFFRDNTCKSYKNKEMVGQGTPTHCGVDVTPVKGTCEGCRMGRESLRQV